MLSLWLCGGRGKDYSCCPAWWHCFRITVRRRLEPPAPIQHSENGRSQLSITMQTAVTSRTPWKGLGDCVGRADHTLGNSRSRRTLQVPTRGHFAGRQYTRISSFSLLQCQFSASHSHSRDALSIHLNRSLLCTSLPPPAMVPNFPPSLDREGNSLQKRVGLDCYVGGGGERGGGLPTHMNEKWNQHLVINQLFLELKRKINPGTWHS